jgi:hypothetical protein
MHGHYTDIVWCTVTILIYYDARSAKQKVYKIVFKPCVGKVRWSRLKIKFTTSPNSNDRKSYGISNVRNSLLCYKPDTSSALFQVTTQLLLLCFTHTTNRVYHLRADGFAHAISIDKDPKMNLVMINKEVYHISFNLTSGILQTHRSFYRRMANRTIIVAAENVSIYITLLRIL